MTKGAPRTHERGNPLDQLARKITIPVRNAILNLDGATGVGFGSVAIGGFPPGNLLILGAAAYMQFTGPADAGLVDTWAGDYGIGTTPASDGTLSAADIDLIDSTALAAATAEASPRTRGVSATAGAGAVLDNTDGSLEVNLSLLVDDPDVSADDIDFTVNGVVVLLYSVLLDD